MLLDIATSLGVDTLVVGSGGRRGMRRLLVGNLAERLLSSTPCSLVVVQRTPAAVEAPKVVPFPTRPTPQEG